MRFSEATLNERVTEVVHLKELRNRNLIIIRKKGVSYSVLVKYVDRASLLSQFHATITKNTREPFFMR